MKKYFIFALLLIVFTLTFASSTEARARYGSVRVGGYTSHGKGSHYVCGYVRSTHTLNYYLKH